MMPGIGAAIDSGRLQNRRRFQSNRRLPHEARLKK